MSLPAGWQCQRSLCLSCFFISLLLEKWTNLSENFRQCGWSSTASTYLKFVVCSSILRTSVKVLVHRAVMWFTVESWHFINQPWISKMYRVTLLLKRDHDSVWNFHGLKSLIRQSDGNRIFVSGRQRAACAAVKIDAAKDLTRIFWLLSLAYGNFIFLWRHLQQAFLSQVVVVCRRQFHIHMRRSTVTSINCWMFANLCSVSSNCFVSYLFVDGCIICCCTIISC